MPLLFVHVADILEQLSCIKTRSPPYLPAIAEIRAQEAITTWFRTHGRRIHEDTDAEALLSTLLPERRTDRVYSLKVKSLEKVLGRVLGLSTSRRFDLSRHKEPGAGDLADCVERIQKQAEFAVPARGNEVSIEEVDSTLLAIASHNNFSSPKVRALADGNHKFDIHHALSRICSRLGARELKWLTRIILKDFSPIVVPEFLVLRSVHALLPTILRVQAELSAALTLLKAFKACPTGENELLRTITPMLGVKVGRQTFHKGRSIKHCVDMAQNRCMAVEKKYDGEYCQVHIDINQPPERQIQIFSKSGKDSTADRNKVHKTIRNCLQMDNRLCKIKQGCILEGELVVFDDKHNIIADFHKIRKHVTRSGVYIGTGEDSQAHDHEHLMIVFFDVLMHDGKHVLGMKQRDRRDLLTDLVTPISGRAAIAESRVLSFALATAAKDLREIFAQCILARGEGLVLKPADEPYFSFESGKPAGGYKSCCIKVKREYFSSFGDVGDFAVVGASYDAATAKAYNIPNMKWTHFWVGCMENKEAVIRYNHTPRFVVVSIVTPNVQIIQSVALHAQFFCSPAEPDHHYDLRIEPGISQGRHLVVTFTTPLVFDMRCFSFDKMSNTGFWTLRFPQVSKLHLDRSWLDTVSFSELQDMGRTSASILAVNHSQTDLSWLRRLEDADPRGIAVDACTPPKVNRPQTTSKSSSPGALVWFSISPLENRSTYKRLSETATSNKGRQRKQADGINTARRRQRTASKLQHGYRTTHDPSPHLQIEMQKEYINDMHGAESNFALGDQGSSLIAKTSRVMSDITKNWSSVSDHCLDTSGRSVRTRGLDVAQCDGSKSLSFIDGSPSASNQESPSTSSDIMCTMEIRRNSSAGSHLFSETSRSSIHAEKSPDRRRSLVRTTLATASRCVQESKILLLKSIGSMCTVYLTPCVADFALLPTDLLAANLINFTTDPTTWFDPRCFPTSCPSTGARIRKICLIEPRRRQKSLQHLSLLSKTAVALRRQENDLIEVYDWRLLKQPDSQHGSWVAFNPWRRYWIGVI